MSHVNWSQALRSRLSPLRPNKYTAVARVHGKSRASALRYLAAKSGYYNHGQRWAFQWDVKAHCGMDFDDLYAVQDTGFRETFADMCKNDGERGLLYHYMQSVYRQHESEWFGWATEGAWMGFQEDAHTFWGDSRDAQFTLAGRSSGHLVIESCGGINTAHSHTDLMYDLSERDTGDHGRYVVGDDAVAHLFLVVVQTDVDCTRASVESEVLHHAAFSMWSMARSDRFEELLTTYRKFRETTLRSSFDGDMDAANDVRAMLGLPQEPTE